MRSKDEEGYFTISKKPTNIRGAAGKIIKDEILEKKIYVWENTRKHKLTSTNDSMVISTDQSLRDLIDGLQRLDQEKAVPDVKANGKVIISPLAKKIAEVEGLNLENIAGTSGRIGKVDVLQALKAGESKKLKEDRQSPADTGQLLFLPSDIKPVPTVQIEKEKALTGSPADTFCGESFKGQSKKKQEEQENQGLGDNILEDVDLEPQRHVERELEGKTMLEVQSPIIQLMTEVDMTEIKELRKSISKKIEKETGVKITFTDFLLMSVAKALVKNPELNGYYDDDQEKPISYADIGLALSSVGEGGKMTFPTIQKADDLNFTQMILARNDLLSRTKKGKLTEDEQKPTFTIVNLGIYGVLDFTSQVHDRCAAALSVGKLVDRMRMVGNEASFRALMRLKLNLDTRVCDGIGGARFLETVVNYMENPAVLLF